MRKTAFFFIITLLSTGASVAFSGGQADRYNEARSYPNKSIDDRISTKEIYEGSILERLKKLEAEHEIIKEIVIDNLKKQ